MTQIDNMQYKGSRADQAGKDPIVKILNSLQTNIYNRANVKHVSQTGLSIVLSFDAEQERNRPRQQKFFLSGAEAYLLRNIIKI
jgi:sulfatase maturation enzyme AslB (radical SAM superfamily)